MHMKVMILTMESRKNRGNLNYTYNYFLLKTQKQIW